ncbi:MAG: chromate transporter [Mycoplasmataceae bacterium]|nr:chromate transporter [Mycoplasmataceae bacterium]
MIKKVSILKVLVFILKVTFLGFGGGNAILPIIKKDVVDLNKWITEDEFDDIVIMTNSLPGASVVETISYIAILLLGKWKGILVTFFGLIPHILLMLGLFLIGSEYIPIHYMSVLFVCVIPVIIAMLISFGIKYIKKANKDLSMPKLLFWFWTTFLFCLFVPAPFNIPAIIIIFAFLFIFLLGKWKDRKKNK